MVIFLKKKSFFAHNKLEIVHNYRYLGLHFSASGSFSLARANLYNRGRLKAYFKLVKDVLSFQSSVKPVFIYLIKLLSLSCYMALKIVEH